MDKQCDACCSNEYKCKMPGSGTPCKGDLDSTGLAVSLVFTILALIGVITGGIFWARSYTTVSS